MKRPYIGGLMSAAKVNNNYERFAYLLRALRAVGVDAQSPHLLEANVPTGDKATMDKGTLYKMVMPGDIYMLSTCDGMICLPGWEISEGTCAEKYMANLFRLPIIEAVEGQADDIGYEGITPGFEEWVANVVEEVTNCVPS